MRILIIEGDVKVARILREGLEADEFTVDLAADGEELLQLCTEIDYDAVILASTVAQADAINLLRKLRKSGSPTRVLFLNGREDVSDCIEALQHGADDCMAKPFSLEELRARLHCLLRRPLELIYKLWVDDLELDRRQRKVTRAGKLIKLTPCEYGILEYLMRNAGRTVTRTMIMGHVWHLPNPEGATKMVDVYINYLRAKVDRGHNQPLIHTTHGVGYSIGSSRDSSHQQAN